MTFTLFNGNEFESYSNCFKVDPFLSETHSLQFFSLTDSAPWLLSKSFHDFWIANHCGIIERNYRHKNFINSPCNTLENSARQYLICMPELHTIVETLTSKQQLLQVRIQTGHCALKAYWVIWFGGLVFKPVIRNRWDRDIFVCFILNSRQKEVASLGLWKKYSKMLHNGGLYDNNPTLHNLLIDQKTAGSSIYKFNMFQLLVPYDLINGSGTFFLFYVILLWDLQVLQQWCTSG